MNCTEEEEEERMTRRVIDRNRTRRRRLGGIKLECVKGEAQRDEKEEEEAGDMLKVQQILNVVHMQRSLL